MENTPKEISKYLELIEESFFTEAFQALKRDTSKIEDVIEQKKAIRTALNIPLQEENLLQFDNKGQLGELASAMSTALEDPYFADMKNRFSSIITSSDASKIVSVCLAENKLQVAGTFAPFAIKDASNYKEILDVLIESNNINGLRFVCENFDNIHFNSGELLGNASRMKPEAMKMLIDEFDFDMNVINPLENNLALNLIAQQNIKNFDWLNKNYGSKINYSNDMIYPMIEKGGSSAELYSVMLGNPNLKPVHLEKIGNFLFNPKSIAKYSETDIYERFFSHKAFDDQAFTLGQGYFIYGLLSKIGNVAKRESNDVVRHYVRVLDTYLNTLESNTVPDSPEFHIVGAAVHVAKMGDMASTNEACVLTIKRFPSYINKPNPSGELPIQQIEKDSFLYQMLLNNGAVPPEPPPTFWTNVLNVFKGKKEKKEVVVEQPQEEVKSTSAQSTIGIIRIKMRNDFRTMRDYLSDEQCDPSIKMKCENMFLKADKLGMVMEKNNLSSFNEELHFLSENFSNYLVKSLKAYIELSHTVNELDAGEQSQSKIQKAKKICLEHVNLLSEQLDLITNNISNGLSNGAMMDLKARGKFLEERFNQSLKDDNSMGDISDLSNNDDENKIVQVRSTKNKI